MDEGRVFKEIGIEGILLIGWGALCQRMDDMWDLLFYMAIRLAIRSCNANSPAVPSSHPKLPKLCGFPGSCDCIELFPIGATAED